MIKRKEITNDIRKFRFSADEMTQQELAERIGVSRQTIISVEKGRYVPSVELALRMAALFKVSVDDLFKLRSTIDEKT